MKRYLNMPDTRPLDDWGLPIGKPYEEKKWEDLTPDEMMADFEWKSDILDSLGEEVSGSTFYQDYLFRELYSGEIEGYKVLVTEYDAEKGSKMHKIDVDDIQDYLHLSDVALSPCLFYSNWRRKKLLNYVSAFVLDIDKLRPMNLQRFFMLFDSNRLLTPTFIANSGSGVHFYYLLDKMLPVDSVRHEAQNQIANEIYRCLYDDVIKKEKWTAAQRHWLGQDYRIVNSKTKFQQTARIFKVGPLYTVDQLMQYYDIKIDRKKNYASPEQVRYAKNIAKDLKIDPPDYTDAKATYEFIQQNQDAAYQVREARRQERAERRAQKIQKGKPLVRRPVTWYKNTLSHMYDHTQPGYRFTSMKALAMIANIEKVPRDVFLRDLNDLAAYWGAVDWHGDDFNSKNVEAIVRFYDKSNGYRVKPETLEEWLGYDFRRVGTKRRPVPLKQKEHLEISRAIRDIRVKQTGKDWRNNDGAPTKHQQVYQWRQNNPNGKKTDCIRATGLSKPTVYKWWDVPCEPELKEKTESYIVKDVLPGGTEWIFDLREDSEDNLEVEIYEYTPDGVQKVDLAQRRRRVRGS